ncbi:nucleotidyl transferase AbiEii/AbiGii toxin family protein [bacterium]|nr:nucleotidyl transferase AbiEii/AbiGii toxin family protein [bacterium]
MSESVSIALNVHDDSDLFREAINFTAAETGFLPRLIEKDYFCSVLLNYFSNADRSLVFKGGTCLTKVHADFYRLSEDLDFVISVSHSGSRANRSKLAELLRVAVRNLPKISQTFQIEQSLTGANQSTQYVAVISYASLVSDQRENVKVELGLREPLLTGIVHADARTILLDPVTVKPIAPLVSVQCISMREAYSEKFRAAMTRRDVAIRDFFDIDYGVRIQNITLEETFIELIRKKIAIPGNAEIDISPSRLAQLRRQIDSDLKPVLRPKDFSAFNLDNVFQYVTEVANAIMRL